MKTDTPTFIDYFTDLCDPRIEDRCDHKLIDILFIAVCAVICGADGFTDMEEFGIAKEAWLRSSLTCLQASLLTIPSGASWRGSSLLSFNAALSIGCGLWPALPRMKSCR